MKKFLLLAFIVISFSKGYAQHAPGYIDSSLETQTWDGAKWIPQTNEIFYYHPFDTLYYNAIVKAWNTATLAYDISQSQELVTYTSSQKMQMDVYQSWVTNQAAWRNNRQFLYTYDAANNQTNNTVQDWDTTLSAWVNTSRTLIMYDNKNNDTNNVSQYWNTGAGNWRNSSLRSTTFDGSNRFAQFIFKSWDTTNNTWVNSQKYSFQYRSADSTYHFTQNWNTTTNMWTDYAEDINAYDASGNHTYIFSFLWTSATATYDSSLIYRFTYNANNELLTEESRTEIAPGGSTFTYTYDSAGNIMTLIFKYDSYEQAGSWALMSSTNIYKEIYTWERATSALPVTFLNFSGNTLGNTIQLHWSTASEINSSYFEIQHSQDGNNFEPLGTLAASGTSYFIKTYAFVDDAPKPNAVNYYRLKQMDKDGHFVYSKIINFNFYNQSAVQVYPNPARQNILVKISGVMPGNYRLNITDVNGSVISSQMYSIAGRSLIIPVSLSGYSSGIYLLTVEDVFNNVIARQKMVKQ